MDGWMGGWMEQMDGTTPARAQNAANWQTRVARSPPVKPRFKLLATRVRTKLPQCRSDGNPDRGFNPCHRASSVDWARDRENESEPLPSDRIGKKPIGDVQ